MTVRPSTLARASHDPIRQISYYIHVCIQLGNPSKYPESTSHFLTALPSHQQVDRGLQGCLSLLPLIHGKAEERLFLRRLFNVRWQLALYRVDRVIEMELGEICTIEVHFRSIPSNRAIIIIESTHRPQMSAQILGQIFLIGVFEEV